MQLFHTGSSEVYVTGYRTEAPITFDDEDGLMMMGEDDSMDEEDSEDDEEEEEESSDDDEAPPGVPLQGGKVRRLIDDAADEDDSSEEEDSESDDEDEEESDEEDEESSEEEEEKKEEAPSKKRKALPQTPQPIKKSKEDSKAPATAPAKVSSGPVSPSNDQDYITALKKYLQKNGPAKPGVLGGAVKRPPKSPKLVKILEQHKDVFNFNQTTQMVSLV